MGEWSAFLLEDPGRLRGLRLGLGGEKESREEGLTVWVSLVCVAYPLFSPWIGNY